MKIEKLTENKIRIILKQEDLKNQDITFQDILLKTEDLQRLFLEILNKAKKEINFDVDGYKLFIETFTSSENVFIFTITKFIEKNNNIKLKHEHNKFLKVKPKQLNYVNKNNIFIFESFENFCNFCYCIHNKKTNTKNLCKRSLLYLYNNKYYLVLKDININNKTLNSFYLLISEFSKFSSNSENFESKLKEHGKIIIKNNVLDLCIKYFCT